MNRPTSVTVIAWLLIAMCVINLVSIATGFSAPVARALFARSTLPETVRTVSGIIGMLATILFAAFMLRGANWARWLYLIWVAFGLVTLLFTASSWIVILPGLIKTLVFGYFLTRRDANAYFKGHSSANAELPAA